MFKTSYQLQGQVYNILSIANLTNQGANPGVTSTNSGNSATFCPTSQAPCVYINTNNTYSYSYLPNYNSDKLGINNNLS